MLFFIVMPVHATGYLVGLGSRNTIHGKKNKRFFLKRIEKFS